MYKRILVAIDGSRTAALGLAEAVELARQQEARLLLVHVVDEHLLLPAMDSFAGAGEAMALLRESGKDVIAKAQAFVTKRGARAESVLLETIAAPAADVIVRQARKWKADLIVVGTHGRRGLRRLVMGSDAEQIVRNAPVPVLLVRARSAAGKRAR
jgi:nucleotide-binding universal stress UspA family protein